MGNSTNTLKMDMEHPIATVTGGSKTSNYSDGLAKILPQAATEGDGPRFRSVLEMDKEASTGHDLSR